MASSSEEGVGEVERSRGREGGREARWEQFDEILYEDVMAGEGRGEGARWGEGWLGGRRGRGCGGGRRG